MGTWDERKFNPSSNTQYHHHHQKKEREPHCEEYAMRESFFQEIKQQLGLNPSIDCFATSTNTKCPKFISREEDSLRVPWRSDETLWLNPPWPLWPRALEKLDKTTSAAIAICPAWNKPWVRKLVGMASRKFYFERGTKLFEFQGIIIRGIPWGLWALRIDKGPRKTIQETDLVPRCLVHPAWRPCSQSQKPQGGVGSKPDMVPTPLKKPILPMGPDGTPVVVPYESQPRMLDLFSRTGSVGQFFEQYGYEVTSVDSAKHFAPTIVTDILKWDYESAFQPGYFDVIFCSPPCAHFSRARTTLPREIHKGDILVQKALEIIKYLRPPRWFLENPRTGLLTGRPYMANIPYVDVDYCQFSDWGYQKPTRIWGDSEILKLPTKICDPHTCANMVERPNGRWGHRQMLGGNDMRATRNQKYRIPDKLIQFLCGWPTVDEHR